MRGARGSSLHQKKEEEWRAPIILPSWANQEECNKTLLSGDDRREDSGPKYVKMTRKMRARLSSRTSVIRRKYIKFDIGGMDYITSMTCTKY